MLIRARIASLCFVLRERFASSCFVALVRLCATRSDWAELVLLR